MHRSPPNYLKLGNEDRVHGLRTACCHTLKSLLRRERFSIEAVCCCSCDGE
jgi:hypothetical protein